jgi:hypothetical protein
VVKNPMNYSLNETSPDPHTWVGYTSELVFDFASTFGNKLGKMPPNRVNFCCNSPGALTRDSRLTW